MSRSAGTITFFLSLLSLVLTIAKAHPIAYGCGSVASDVAYQEAVTNIMAYLYVNTATLGFSSGKQGDAVGYALCRGDINFVDCNNCVYQATDEILGLCPTSQKAFVYYDYCYISYISIEEKNTYAYDSNIYYCLSSSVHVSDPVLFDGLLDKLFRGIAASAQQEPRFIGAGYIRLGGSYVLYGYVQCFNDISGWDCKACIDALTTQLPNTCTHGFVGGRLVGGTCLLRFELYYFLNW